jgi:hypothetical protein
VSQLSEFVKKRSINNVITATVVSVKPSNPAIVDVKLPDMQTVTLSLAQLFPVSPGDPVEVVRPQGNSKLEYVSGPAAILLGGDPFNRVVGAGQG